MGKSAIIFFQELRILLKDKQALGLLFIMPVALIVFLSLALQDVYLSKVGKTIELEIVSSAPCETSHSVCSRLVTELKKFQYQIQVSQTLSPSPKAQMVLILPEKMENTLKQLKAGKILSEKDQIQLVFDPTLDQSLRALVQSHLFLSLQAVLIEQAYQEMKKVLPPGSSVSKMGMPQATRFEGLIREQTMGDKILPNPIQQTVPAWALFGMFFIVIPISGSMIRDRNLGIFKRLLSFPISKTNLIAGKILPFLMLNVFQFVFMFGVGVFLLPHLSHLSISLSFNLWHVLSVTLVSAFAATSYGLMISCLCKTQEQASAFGALSVVILAILGGVMIPRIVMPDTMQSISLISPLYWGLEAYHDVILRKLLPAVFMKKLGVLAGFGLVCSWISLVRFRWNEI